jgi:hypothetical protein
MLFSLMDGHARISTELAVVAEVSPSTASAHLNRLKAERLIRVLALGKHRYYSLEGPNVASALEALSVLSGGVRSKFVPNTPSRLRLARTCYDHMAGSVGVSLHDRFKDMAWLSAPPNIEDNSYGLTVDWCTMSTVFGPQATALPQADWSRNWHQIAAHRLSFDRRCTSWG